MKHIILFFVIVLSVMAGAAVSPPHPLWREQETNFTRRVEKEFDRELILDYLVAPREIMKLDGQWLVHHQPEKAWTTNNATESIWCYSTNALNLSKIKWGKVTLPKDLGPWSNVHHLKRIVNLTEEQASRAVIIKAESMTKSYKLIVNGSEVAYVPQCLGFEMHHDITSKIHSGENEIYFIIWQHEEQPYWKDRLKGTVNERPIQYPIYLEFRDMVSVEDIFMKHQVATKKIWRADVTITNRTDSVVSVTLNADIEDGWNGVKKALNIPAKGSIVTSLSQDWDDGKVWSPATPNLYYSRFSLVRDNRLTDAVRERFGFRDVVIKGGVIFLNGKPFMMRRTTATPKTKEEFDRLRKNGYVGLRIFFPNRVERLSRLADEYGFLVTLCPEVGWGAAYRNDIFWQRYEAALLEMVKCYKNHPSIICWAVSNEFGYVYGGAIGSENKEEARRTVEKQQKAAKVVEVADPTRPWTACSEAGLGYPKGSRGIAPIVSLHYPFPILADWCGTFPSVCYWFADGGGGWQEMNLRDKPICISEDVYHGVIDAFKPLSKVGGDSIYMSEGYAQTFHKFMRALAEGHYTGSLAGWDPWCVHLMFKDNRLPQNGRGALHPDYLIAMRDVSPNLFAGEDVSRKVIAFNQWFAPVKGEFVEEIICKGKVISSSRENIEIDSGARFEKEVKLKAPNVNKATEFLWRFSLVENENELATREIPIVVFPKEELKVPAKAALLATTNSPLWALRFSSGKFIKISDLLKSKPQFVVVDKPLLIYECQQLEEYVENGGRVLMSRMDPNSNLPGGIEMDKRKLASRLFRRSEDRMTDVIDESLHSWRMMPDDATEYHDSNHTIAINMMRQPLSDSTILFDAGYQGGITHAAVMWLPRGKGAWLLNATDALNKKDIDPAAQPFLQSLLKELIADNAPVLRKKLIFANPNSELANFLSKNGFVAQEKKDLRAKDLVIVFDAENKPVPPQVWQKLSRAAKEGSDVALFNMAKEENSDVLDTLKIDWMKWDAPEVERPYGARDVMVKNDNGPKFVTRRHNKGLMQGIVNDWLFWWDYKMMVRWANLEVFGTHYPLGACQDFNPIMNGIIKAREDFSGDLLTDYAAMGFANVGKGRIFFSTLNMNKVLDSNGENISKVVRALLTNMGARTIAQVDSKKWNIVDFSKQMTHTLWDDPKMKDKDGRSSPAPIFNGPYDLRYFPVNNCGWSLQSNNFCPVEEFPTEPIRYCGVPFKIENPATNNGLSALLLKTKGKVKIMLPPKTKIEKIYFLGARKGFVPQDGGFSVSFGGKGSVSFTAKEHIGIINDWNPSKLSSGSVAWRGGSVIDRKIPSFLYVWSGENPNPKEEVGYLELTVTTNRTEIGILGITTR